MAWWNVTIKKLESMQKTYHSLYEVIFSNHDKVFSEINNQKKTYQECKKDTNNYANVISELLIKEEPNSYVGIYLDNTPDFLSVFFSVLMSGFRPLLLNTKTSELNLQSIIKTTNPVLIISDRNINFNNYLLLSKLKAITSNHIINCKWANEIALCSTGTTGTPKIVMFDGDAIIAQLMNSKYVFEHNAHIGNSYHGVRKHLAFCPFYHVFGLFSVLLWYAIYGDTFVFITDYRPLEIIKLCNRSKVTHIYSVPVFWNTIAKIIKEEIFLTTPNKNMVEEKINRSIFIQSKNDLLGRKFIQSSYFKNVCRNTFGDSLMYCVNGAGYIFEDTIKTINAIGYPLYNGFGMTEVGIASVELSYKINKRIMCSIGTPFASVEYKVIPFNDEDPSIGELAINGKSLYSSIYYNNKIIKNNYNEWFLTGDVVKKEKNGHYFIHGKVKDIIIGESGENVYPSDIEQNFNIDNVKNICAVGIINNLGYDDIYLIIEIDPKIPGFKMRKMLYQINEINNKLKSTFRVKRFLFTNEPLPLAMNIKIKRNVLKEQIEKNEIKYFEYNLNDYISKDKIINDNMKEIINQVKMIYGEILNINPNDINDHAHFIFDLGGNSLNYYSLVSKIEEKFNIKYNMDTDTLCSTPYDFALYIEKK